MRARDEFWAVCSIRAALCRRPFDYHDDKQVIDSALDLPTGEVPTRLEELKREDYAEAGIVLSQKLEEFAPHVVAFCTGNVLTELMLPSGKMQNFGLAEGAVHRRDAVLRPAFTSQSAAYATA